MRKKILNCHNQNSTKFDHMHTFNRHRIPRVRRKRILRFNHLLINRYRGFFTVVKWRIATQAENNRKKHLVNKRRRVNLMLDLPFKPAGGRV